MVRSDGAVMVAPCMNCARLNLCVETALLLDLILSMEGKGGYITLNIVKCR